MTEPYLGEIRMFGGNFAPRGWVMCDGQLLSIAENDALYNLLGTTYGGDGVNTFGCSRPARPGSDPPGLEERPDLRHGPVGRLRASP
jgi:microcystin-dependent protein